MKHVILGNGPAGVLAAETLRKAAPTDEIVMVGCEDAPPYSRMAIPYLLMNRIGEPGMYLRKSEDHFDKLGITQIRGRAARVNDQARTITLESGEFLNYDRLLIATGATPIMPPIPGMTLANVHSCWTLDDARAIIAKAAPGSRVLQVGAGFIGCIILEALAARGVKLTVVEMGDRMVPRMMTPVAGNMLRRWVETKGVKVVTSTKVDKIEDGSPMRAHLSNGEIIECDLVIASAGVRPNLEFVTGSRVHLLAGVVVDEYLRTSVPEIYAAGDVTSAADFGTGRHGVNAIHPDATDQARIAALNMAGKVTKSQGSFAMNVLDTMGLISTSFGQWEGKAGGDTVELADEAHFNYISLQFDGDVLIGATSVGVTQHVGALRGLIQNRTKLGPWKKILMETPARFYEAFIATQQPCSLIR